MLHDSSIYVTHKLSLTCADLQPSDIIHCTDEVCCLLIYNSCYMEIYIYTKLITL